LLNSWPPTLHTEPPAQVSAGGLLSPEADRVAAAFAASGLVETERRTRGEWTSIALVRG
jgi:ribosomal protein L11 methylase PrmA